MNFKLKAMGGKMYAAGGSFNNPGFNALPVKVQNKIRANSFAEGGQMNQLTEFNEGGRHEENPLGGIPQGMSQDGQVNLVEEGETKQKLTDEGTGDFIYSDSIKIDKEFAETYSLPKSYIGKTYAEASKLANRPNSRRENDTIEQVDIKRKLDSLAEAQEAQKTKAEQKQLAEELAANPELMEQLMSQIAMNNQSVQPMGMPQGEEVAPDQVPQEMLAQMPEAQQGMPVMRYGGNMYRCGGKMYDFGGWMDDNSGAISGAASGAVSGAAMGAKIGSIVPGPGTAIGTVAGLLIGGAVGGAKGNKEDQAEEKADNEKRRAFNQQNTMVQMQNDPTYVTPAAQYALQAGMGTTATMPYAISKYGGNLYKYGGNMYAEGGMIGDPPPAGITRALDPSEIDAWYNRELKMVAPGTEVIKPTSMWVNDDWKGDLANIHKYHTEGVALKGLAGSVGHKGLSWGSPSTSALTFAPTTAAPPSLPEGNMYLSANTGEPVYDIDPTTGESMPRMMPEGSTQNRQYSQYIEQFANSPEQIAKRKNIEAQKMSNQQLLESMTEEEKARARELKLSPTKFLEEYPRDNPSVPTLENLSFEYGGQLGEFNPNLMPTNSNARILELAGYLNSFDDKKRKRKEKEITPKGDLDLGKDSDYTDEDRAMDEDILKNIKEKASSGQTLTEEEMQSYKSILQRLNENLDSNDLDLSIKANLGEVAAMAAPAAYNIGMGVFGKAQRLDPQDYKSRANITPWQYNVNPQLRQIQQGFAGAQDALRNAGLSGGNYATNIQNLYNQRNIATSRELTQKQNIDAQSYNAAQMANAEIERGNLGMDFTVQDYNAKAAAAKQRLAATGLEQVGGIGRALLDMKGQQALVKSVAPDFAGSLNLELLNFLNKEKKKTKETQV